MERAGTLAAYLGVVHLSVLSHHQLHRMVDLVVEFVRAFVTFHDGRMRALADDNQRAREQSSCGRGGVDELQVNWPGNNGAFGDSDYRAVSHERSIERDRDVVGRNHGAERADNLRIAGRERTGHGNDRQPGIEPGKIGQVGHECAVNEHEPLRVKSGQKPFGLARARDRGGIRRPGERLGVAHQRAQIGVLPFLDAPVRQTVRLETAERRGTLLGSSRQLAPCRSKGLGKPLLGRSSDRSDVGAHRNDLTPLRPGTAHSRSPRARGPIPCRRSSRCAPSTARGPHREQCIRAAADSA